MWLHLQNTIVPYDDQDGYTELYGPYSVTTITLDSSTFALVAGRNDNGVQIIDITDPYNPAPASAITNYVGGYTQLHGVILNYMAHTTLPP